MCNLCRLPRGWPQVTGSVWSQRIPILMHLFRLTPCALPVPQAACLAKCNGARVSLHRAGTFTLEDFRQQVIDVASSGEEHIIVSYTRKAFLQTGDGHFSPVGGYHGGRDLVLILDTVRRTWARQGCVQGWAAVLGGWWIGS